MSPSDSFPLSAPDRSAMEGLFREWSPRVMELAWRLARDPEEARELHQTAFLKVLGSRRSFAGRSGFGTWLYQVVINAWRDRGRSEAVRRRRTAEFATRHAERLAPASWEGGARREAAERVAAALDALPAEEREVVLLKHYSGLSFAEVGRVLGQPSSTVKSRLVRALDRLRPHLEDLLP